MTAARTPSFGNLWEVREHKSAFHGRMISTGSGDKPLPLLNKKAVSDHREHREFICRVIHMCVCMRLRLQKHFPCVGSKSGPYDPYAPINSEKSFANKDKLDWLGEKSCSHDLSLSSRNSHNFSAPLQHVASGFWPCAKSGKRT